MHSPHSVDTLRFIVHLVACFAISDTIPMRLMENGYTGYRNEEEQMKLYKTFLYSQDKRITKIRTEAKDIAKDAPPSDHLKRFNILTEKIQIVGIPTYCCGINWRRVSKAATKIEKCKLHNGTRNTQIIKACVKRNKSRTRRQSEKRGQTFHEMEELFGDDLCAWHRANH